MNEERCCDNCAKSLSIINPEINDCDRCNRLERQDNWQPKPISESVKIQNIIKHMNEKYPNDNNLGVLIAGEILANYRPKSKSVDSEELLEFLEKFGNTCIPLTMSFIKQYIKQQTEVRC